MSLSLADRQYLLKLARETIARHLRGEGPPPVDLDALPESLTRDGVCFVTLTKHDGQLRGCIGSLEARRPLVLDVRGPDTDVLVGYRGETLAALQRITRLIVGREMAGRVRLVVDVDGFKARREQSLRRLAQRMAEQAVRSGHTAVLEPMSPYERRIVHIALREHPQVTTQSVGEGDRRKVTIIPRH